MTNADLLKLIDSELAIRETSVIELQDACKQALRHEENPDHRELLRDQISAHRDLVETWSVARVIVADCGRKASE
jgi:hypothetical protein